MTDNGMMGGIQNPPPAVIPEIFYRGIHFFAFFFLFGTVGASPPIDYDRGIRGIHPLRHSKFFIRSSFKTMDP